MAMRQVDLPRIMLAVLVVGALLGTSIWILLPFLTAAIWASALAIATWSLMLRLQHLLWNKRPFAVIVMTLVISIVFVAPLWAAVDMIVVHASQFREWAETLVSADLPSAPPWLGEIPIIGNLAERTWAEIVDADLTQLIQWAKPYTGTATHWVIASLGDVVLVLVQFLLIVVFAAVLYARGESAGMAVLRLSRRIAGDRGERSVRLAAQSVRSVALGVVVTAVVQGTISSVGLIITGVPFGKMLSALAFILCVAQIGPTPVLVPAAIWMYASRDPFWATVLIGFTILAVTMDNVLRPLLIHRGANVPLLLLLVGVFGGLLAFGLIGLFVGPTILAVTYTLALEWIFEETGQGPIEDA
jgi:predicted PurR-regulated permease PerM